MISQLLHSDTGRGNLDLTETDDSGDTEELSRFLEEPEVEDEVELQEMADPDQIEDPAELRRLLQQAEAQLVQLRNQNPADGGNQGRVLYKEPPPDMDKCSSYDIWRIRLETWLTTSSMSDTQKAAALMDSIGDDHKLKKNLGTALVRSLTPDQRKAPKTAELLTFLDDQFQHDNYEETWKLWLDANVNNAIKSGEKYKDFVGRFDAAYNALVNRDETMKLAARHLSLMLIHAARLEGTMLMNVKANIV